MIIQINHRLSRMSSSRLVQVCSLTLMLIVIVVATGVNFVQADGDGVGDSEKNVQFHPLSENQRQFANSYPTEQQQRLQRQIRQAEEVRQVRGNPTAAFQLSEGKAVVKAVKKVTKLKKAVKKGKKSSASATSSNWKSICLLPITLAFYFGF